jgi:hypothetical protein
VNPNLKRQDLKMTTVLAVAPVGLEAQSATPISTISIEANVNIATKATAKLARDGGGAIIKSGTLSNVQLPTTKAQPSNGGPSFDMDQKRKLQCHNHQLCQFVIETMHQGNRLCENVQQSKECYMHFNTPAQTALSRYQMVVLPKAQQHLRMNVILIDTRWLHCCETPCNEPVLR